MAEASESRIGDGGGEEEGHWAQLAQKHWSKPTNKTKKIKADVIKKEIWDVLAREAFGYRSLLQLESLQLLEKYRIVKSLRDYAADKIPAICGPAIAMLRRTRMSS